MELELKVCHQCSETVKGVELESECFSWVITISLQFGILASAFLKTRYF